MKKIAKKNLISNISQYIRSVIANKHRPILNAIMKMLLTQHQLLSTF